MNEMKAQTNYPEPTTDDLKIIPFSELQGFMHWRINKTYNEMLGHKNKHSVENYNAKVADQDVMSAMSWGLAMSFSEFREEAYSELSMIYCEAVKAYDPEKLIPFIGFFSFKAGDLGGRMFRLMSHSSNVKHREDYAKNSPDQALTDWRLSLSVDASDLLAELETGKGFKLKKTAQASKGYDCHIGMDTFWKQFLSDRMDRSKFRRAYKELVIEYRAIQFNDSVYVLTDTSDE